MTTDNKFKIAAEAAAEAARSMAALLRLVGGTRDDPDAFAKKVSRLAGMATEIDRLATYYGPMFDPVEQSKNENVRNMRLRISMAADAVNELFALISDESSPLDLFAQSIDRQRCTTIQQALAAIADDLAAAVRETS